MKRLTNPELKVIRFASEDVIATSLYYATSAAFNAAQGTNFTSDYVMFNGSMRYDGDLGAYLISDIKAPTASSAEDKVFFSGGYIPEAGITLPPHGNGYDAYEYNGGLYTNGVSYVDRSGQ